MTYIDLCVERIMTPSDEEEVFSLQPVIGALQRVRGRHSFVKLYDAMTSAFERRINAFPPVEELCDEDFASQKLREGYVPVAVSRALACSWMDYVLGKCSVDVENRTHSCVPDLRLAREKGLDAVLGNYSS